LEKENTLKYEKNHCLSLAKSSLIQIRNMRFSTLRFTIGGLMQIKGPSLKEKDGKIHTHTHRNEENDLKVNIQQNSYFSA
jgi:hypothetical protein